ncbi:1-deoxy-D-xylulose-5-phosphate synthase [Nautilia profundicola AmH]|uniref:1-deoxy-D-xylulose-5-phosphate synthase n=1 Tax=Nautilia profundicola (strain ATCC BAA-1463 / DSM 18972 / AmH) TaxID=598659 RepID=B9LA37_NAUPA|nr:1-deoxy-D-xylulose-5-phosphate synthase [Nautilia profundicola]ACM92314.1 1-deoxy-D-xylulose-5-phosphate synthase [Nautilia profundicola AmH]
MIDVKSKNIVELEKLAQDIRKRILEVVSAKGGHLSSTLGAVELIIAMHYVFDVEKDPFIFDVSHQAYAHKLLTGRWDEFDTLRQFGGISGYTKPSESKYDYFSAGHSSTSISVAVGAAKAIKLKGEERIPVVLIGDGAMSAGMVYEALNELGFRKYPVVIILNDNEMSIGKPIGALSKYLTRLKAGKLYQGFKEKFKKFLDSAPKDVKYMAKKFEEMFSVHGVFFEEMGLEYIGPIDGHNLEEVIETLEVAKSLKKPVIVHAKTIKGKGYEQAEGYYEHWHGVGPFDLKTGKPLKKSSLSATKVYSETLLELAKEDKNIVGVTAAMPSGTGMKELMKEFPERFWDVGIAEQHAVTSMAPLAKEGFIPFVAIYSTFLQRGYDQIIHDVCLDNYPVRFAIDRAGIVGADGETHQGVFDIGYLRILPNITIFAPRDFETLKKAVRFAKEFNDGPCAFRYPRGAFTLEDEVFDAKDFELGKAEVLIDSDNIMFIAYGNGVGKAYKAHKLLKEQGIDTGVVDLRFVKPFDKELLRSLRAKKWYVISDNAKEGGIAEMLSDFVNSENLDVSIESFEYPDEFIPHGDVESVERLLKVDVQSIVEKIKDQNA